MYRLIIFILFGFLLLAQSVKAGCQNDLNITVRNLSPIKSAYTAYDYTELDIKNLSKNKIVITSVKLLTENDDVMDIYQPKTFTEWDAIPPFSYKFLKVGRSGLIYDLLKKYEVACAYLPDQNLSSKQEVFYVIKPIQKN
jgi:hypothetical protein